MGCLVMLYQLLCLVLFCLSSQPTLSLSSFVPSKTPLCFHTEASALFKFKSSFSIKEYASLQCEDTSTPSYPKTNSWKEGSDCCTWDGVTCDNVTGNVIGLDLSCSCLYGSFPSNTTLFHLPHLQKLNLAHNDFNHSKMSSGFAQFKSLMQLNLSYSFFSGQIPPKISHLSKLVTLDLSMSSYQTLDRHTLRGLVQNVTEVRQLFLDDIDMSSVNPNVLMNMSSSLSSLSLGGCSLHGKFPENIFHLPNLKLLNLVDNIELNIYLPNFNQSNHLDLLDLSSTNLSGALPNSISNLVSLKYLYLSFTNLFGALPHSIGSLVCLEELHLDECNFSGIIPTSFGNLSQLNSLSLSENHFSGQISSSLTNLTQLESIDIYGNQLEGSIPNEVTTFPNLIHIDLSSNFLNGTLPSWLYTNPSLKYISLSDNQLNGHIKQFQYKSLERIQLGNNKLQGPIPSSISQLVNLTWLDLSSNNLSGIVESDLFSNLQSLTYLDLSYNNFYFNSSHTSVDHTLPNLQSLYLSFCNVNRFPQFLRGSNVLTALDLSNNRINGEIPKWMWDVGKDPLKYLNLSYNAITELKQLPSWGTEILDLSSNQIQGNLPIPSRDTSIFIISNNNLSGGISDLICNLYFLEVLDMSHNNLSGTIPQCFGKLSKILWILNLAMNKLHGTIPSSFEKGCRLKNLNLNANQLEGPLTQSILNCRRIQLLDLGNNKINGSFPHWLGTLQELKVLVLQSNQMHGSINGKRHTHSFPKLQILDLSNNNFSGQLPTRYIENLKGMMNVEENRDVMPYIGGSLKKYTVFYSYSVHLVEKGQTVELMKIFATLTIIDLSNNKFEGEIPGVIGKLSSIIGLNLSHNLLNGHIPPSFGSLINLEWLDLSSNKLGGEIPNQLLNLTMLSSLNLSKNDLVGCIPEGKQFNTFENSSYQGNDGLCGFPLSKDCNSKEAEQPAPSTLQKEAHSISEFRFGWKIMLIGYASGFVFGVGMGCVVLQTGKPKWLVRWVEIIWLVRLVGVKRHRRPKKPNKNARASGRRS